MSHLLASLPAAALVALGWLSGSFLLAAPEPDLPVLGEDLFLLHCAECHGINGDGFGERANVPYARPRSFASGHFKLTTTENQVPSDEDLKRTIRYGMPGSGMPNWGWLGETEVGALATFVRHLTNEGLRLGIEAAIAEGRMTRETGETLLAERTTPGAPIVIPDEPAPTPQGTERGRRIYAEACASCHGKDGHRVAGQGLSSALKNDAEGNWLPPTSLRRGVFKGGGEGSQLYARLYKGMNGTAMPAYGESYSPQQLWDVVHYVQHLATLGVPQASEALATEEADAPDSAPPVTSSGTQTEDSERGFSIWTVFGLLAVAGVLLLLFGLGSTS